MSLSLVITANRTFDFSGTILDADGTAVTLQSTDNIRFKMGRRGTTSLDIDNDANANGSVTAIVSAAAGTYTLRIAQDDTVDLEPGPYSAELVVIDDSETAPADAAKAVEHGTVTVLEALDGDLTQA